ncbi:hypothetical protein T12_1889 [Trichinella patagoniensis]|uniref:Uncharacterized protein n=1 Tax=Trichinella patagoniensis TaxID=990121 RepID=A0A0V1AEY7_9BILA|nr:hypothetical protein T12_1889 [Trichinella patagoniensis]
MRIFQGEYDDLENGLCYKNNLKTYSFTDSQYNIDESVISTRPHKFMVLKLYYKLKTGNSFTGSTGIKIQIYNISTLYHHNLYIIHLGKKYNFLYIAIHEDILLQKGFFNNAYNEF